MFDKQVVLDLLIDCGATISIPYKDKIMDWFTECKLRYSTSLEMYIVYDAYDGFNKYKTFDEAWEVFSKLLSNVGVIMQRVIEDVEEELGEECELEYCQEHREVLAKHINQEWFDEFAQECKCMDYSHPSGSMFCYHDVNTKTVRCDKSKCPLWTDKDIIGEVA